MPHAEDGYFYVSQSKVNAWLDCRLKYHFRHVEHLKPKVKSRPFQFGGMAHKILEVQAQGGDEEKALKDMVTVNRKLFTEEVEMYGRIADDMSYIMRAYKKFWAKEPIKYIKFQGRKAEHPFEVELTSEIKVKGKIDALAKMKGFKWLAENKTHKDFPNDNHRWKNLQSALYLRILNMLGVEGLEGTLWNYIRSKPPTRPQLLKAGTLSEKSIDSLPEVVIDTITEHKLDPANYRAFIKTQEDNLPSWFQRVYTPIKPTVIKHIFRDFVTVAREMADWYDKHPDSRPVRTVGKHCDWCAFEGICRAELQGNDVDFLREREFVVDASDYQEDTPNAS
jgi:CRISPR/Cas system-associated exonuclease Cas4 (RecB family)